MSDLSATLIWYWPGLRFRTILPALVRVMVKPGPTVPVSFGTAIRAVAGAVLGASHTVDGTTADDTSSSASLTPMRAAGFMTPPTRVLQRYFGFSLALQARDHYDRALTAPAGGLSGPLPERVSEHREQPHASLAEPR